MKASYIAGTKITSCGLLFRAILVFLLVLPILFQAIPAAPVLAQIKDRLPAASTGVTAKSVQIGIYVLNLSHLDIKSETFYADFYVWYKWKGEWFNPADMEFMNGDISYRTEPSHEKVGEWDYSISRIKGVFKSQFSLYNYPFDSQTLSIVLEHRDMNLAHLVLASEGGEDKDISDNAIEKNMTLSDWKIGKAWAGIGQHRYNTDFGYYVKGNEGEGDSVYSKFVFNVKIERIMLPYLLKFSLPLFILVLMSFLVFFINAKEFEAQCGICVTAILSCIALHLSQGDNLPQVGYLVSADKFFILSYILIFFTLVETVVCNNFAKKGQTDLAARLDTWSKILFPVAMIVGLAALLLPNM